MQAEKGRVEREDPEAGPAGLLGYWGSEIVVCGRGLMCARGSGEGQPHHTKGLDSGALTQLDVSSEETRKTSGIHLEERSV